MDEGCDKILLTNIGWKANIKGDKYLYTCIQEQHSFPLFCRSAVEWIERSVRRDLETVAKPFVQSKLG
jgi:hypothetical protein